MLRARLKARPSVRLAAPARSAAVLALLTGGAGDWRILITRRAAALRRQPGDFALPGGMMEPGDGSELATALRETREEIGLDPAAVDVVGRLHDRITIQGFRLSPFVGVVRPEGRWSAGPEVDEVFEAPITALLAPGVEASELRPFPRGAVGAGGGASAPAAAGLALPARRPGYLGNYRAHHPGAARGGDCGVDPDAR